MTKFKKILAITAALAMCLALAACSGSSGEATASPSADPSPSQSADPSPSADTGIQVDLTQALFPFASGLADTDVAMTVDGAEISNQLYLYWLAYDCSLLSSYAQYGMTVDFSDEKMASYVLSDSQAAVVYYAVLARLCEENGAGLTAKQSADIQKQIDDYEAENGEGSLAALLRRSGLDEAAFRNVISNNYLFNNLADAVVGKPTDEDLEKYVEENGIFSVKHILLKTTDEDVKGEDGAVTQTAEEYNAAQKALAEDLLAQLQASDDRDALFDTLMEEYSEDGRSSDGKLISPDGYTFDSTSSLVSGFREATLALKVGEMSGIAETDYGYHILLRLPVDASGYESKWISDETDALIVAGTQEAEVTVADEIQALNVADFYERYLAYLTELQNESAVG